MIESPTILLVQSQGTDVSTWIALTIGGLGLLYVFMRPKSKKNRDALSAAPNFSLSQQRSVERQMETLLVELSKMARQITAQLDTRATKLELLIRDADDRLAELKSLTGQSNTSGPVSIEEKAASLPRTEIATEVDLEPTAIAPQVGVDHRYDDVYSLSDEGHTAIEIARQLGRPAGEVELILALRPR